MLQCMGMLLLPLFIANRRKGVDQIGGWKDYWKIPNYRYGIDRLCSP